MKTVSGTIVSTKPVSLSKAANILSNFVNNDNGASQAVSAYLRRASNDFNELVYFKKHHKFKNKEEASVKSDLSHRNHEEHEHKVLEKDGVKSEDDKVRKKEKKRKKIDGGLGSEQKDKIKVEVVEQGDESVKEKKKKKRKNAEVESAENGDLEVHKKKKRRKMKTEAADE